MKQKCRYLLLFLLLTIIFGGTFIFASDGYGDNSWRYIYLPVLYKRCASSTAGSVLPNYRWDSNITVMNTSNDSIYISMDIYNTNGTVVMTYAWGWISARQKADVYLPNVGILDGRYSARVMVNGPAQVDVSSSTRDDSNAYNANGTSGYMSMAYEGVGTDDTGWELYAPAFYMRDSRRKSEVVVMNAGDTGTTITFSLLNCFGNPVKWGVASYYLGPRQTTTFSYDTSYACCGVYVSSDNKVPLAATVNTGWKEQLYWAPYNTSSYRNVYRQGAGAYTMTPNGSRRQYLPSIFKNYYGFESIITLLNPDNISPVDVEVKYSKVGITDRYTLQPYQTVQISLENDSRIPHGTLLGVQVNVVSNNGRVLAESETVLRHLWNLSMDGYPMVSYSQYQGIVFPEYNVSIPKILGNYYGWFTGVSVQNCSSYTRNITLNYEDGLNWTRSNINPGDSCDFTHKDNVPGNPHAGYYQFYQSATVLGGLTVATISHNTESGVSGCLNRSGDWLSTIRAMPFDKKVGLYACDGSGCTSSNNNIIYRMYQAYQSGFKRYYNGPPVLPTSSEQQPWCGTIINNVVNDIVDDFRNKRINSFIVIGYSRGAVIALEAARRARVIPVTERNSLCPEFKWCGLLDMVNTNIGEYSLNAPSTGWVSHRAKNPVQDGPFGCLTTAEVQGAHTRTALNWISHVDMGSNLDNMYWLAQEAYSNAQVSFNFNWVSPR